MNRKFAEFIIGLGNTSKDHSLLKPIRLNIILIVGQLIIIAVFFGKLPPQIPLLYSLAWGEKQLTNLNMIFLLPLFSFVFAILNFIISSLLVQKEEQRFLPSLLNWSSFWFSFLCLIAVFKIVTIVT